MASLIGWSPAAALEPPPTACRTLLGRFADGPSAGYGVKQNGQTRRFLLSLPQAEQSIR
jgi:hypothetical protein